MPAADRIAINLLIGSPPAPQGDARRRWLIEQIKAAPDADLLVLPYMGQYPPFWRVIDRADGFAHGERAPFASLAAIATAVKDRGIRALATAFAVVAEGVFYAVAVLIEPDGDAVAIYRQEHAINEPGWHERLYFQPGDNDGLPLLDINGLSIGLLLGGDLWVPEAARRLRLGGGSSVAIGEWSTRGVAQQRAQHGAGSRDRERCAGHLDQRRRGWKQRTAGRRHGERWPSSLASDHASAVGDSDCVEFQRSLTDAPTPPVSVACTNLGSVFRMTDTSLHAELGSPPLGYYRRAEPLAGVLLHPDYQNHANGDHPDNRFKIDRIGDVLLEMPWADRLMRFYPRYARPEQVALAHDEKFVALVESSAKAGSGWFDTDTRVAPGSYETALLAAGGVISAVDNVMMTAFHRPDSIFCIVRPPGHHAYADRAMGFCVFNNVAIAARYAQATFSVERVMIVDWDVHHGNGTNEIFAEDPSVLFVSIHQWPLYPGLGWLTDVGRGAGEGTNINIPVPPGAGDAMYRAIFDRIIEPVAEQFKPDLILVSAGQDCHCSDPLSDANVTYQGFREMEFAIRRMAACSCEGRHVLALEGGYNQHTLPYTVASIVSAMADASWEIEDTLAPPDGAPLTASQEARIAEVMKELKPYWNLQ